MAVCWYTNTFYGLEFPNFDNSQDLSWDRFGLVCAQAVVHFVPVNTKTYASKQHESLKTTAFSPVKSKLMLVAPFHRQSPGGMHKSSYKKH
jgi:hypothetical protein